MIFCCLFWWSAWLECNNAVRIQHSADGDNLSKISCQCQSIEINNNKHVYSQNQVRMSNGSGVEWAECSLITRAGCRVQILAWSSIAQSVCQRVFSLLEIRSQTLSGFESCIPQRKTTCLLSIRKVLSCARASKLTATNTILKKIKLDVANQSSGCGVITSAMMWVPGDSTWRSRCDGPMSYSVRNRDVTGFTRI